MSLTATPMRVFLFVIFASMTSYCSCRFRTTNNFKYKIKIDTSDSCLSVMYTRPVLESNQKFTPEVELKKLMIKSLNWYRDTLSPLMPPNCRFLPSCSKYAIQAVEELGPTKGGVLIAWRLLRCNPIGGSGYDPPHWPPVSFRHPSDKPRKKLDDDNLPPFF